MHMYIICIYIHIEPLLFQKGSKQTCNHTLRLRWCTLVDYHRLFPLILFPPIQPDLLILNRNPAMNIGDVIPAPHTSSSIVGFSRINYQPQLGRTQDLEPSTVVITFQVCLIPFVQNRFTFEVKIVKGTKKGHFMMTSWKFERLNIGCWCCSQSYRSQNKSKSRNYSMTHYSSSLKSIGCYRFLFKNQFRQVVHTSKDLWEFDVSDGVQDKLPKGYHVNCCHWLLQNCSRVEPGR